MVIESFLDSFPEAVLCVILQPLWYCMFTLHKLVLFPNTSKFNLLTIHFTNVACNLTADNSYHGTISFTYCLLAVAILADFIWNGICICVEMIMLCLVHSFIHSCSLLHQTIAVLCPVLVDQWIGWQVLGCYRRDGELTSARKIKSNEWFTLRQMKNNTF